MTARTVRVNPHRRETLLHRIRRSVALAIGVGWTNLDYVEFRAKDR